MAREESYKEFAKKAYLPAPPPSSPFEQRMKHLMYQYPVYAPMFSHYDDAGCMKPCCLSVLTSLEASVGALGNFNDVLDFLSTSFTWGGNRCPYVCQAKEWQKGIDCGSRGCISMSALRFTKECRQGKMRVAALQMVRRCSAEEGQRWLGAFDRQLGDTLWVLGDISFHQCVVLIDDRDNCHFWDFTRNYLVPLDSMARGSMLAMRISEPVLPTSDPHFPAEISAPPRLSAQLVWEGRTVPTGEWVTLLPPELRLEGVRDVADFNQERRAPAPHPPTSNRALVDAMALPCAEDAMPGLRPTVYISGNSMNDGNCMPGVGCARAIRHRFPDAKLIGVDFSEEAGGLIDAVFDDVLVIGFGGCSVVNDHWDDVCALLRNDPKALYLPTMDIEVELLACLLSEPDRVKGNEDIVRRIMVPGEEGFEATEKPEIEAGHLLDMITPRWASVANDEGSEHDMHAFCLHHGYPVYVKGPSYGATLCHSWSEVKGAFNSMTKLWGSGVYLQAAEKGFGMGIMFCAVEGELTTAVVNRKMTTTSMMKGWGGQLTAVDDKMLEQLRSACRALNWTGGGEVEYMEALDGNRYIVDWNPRFPANIFGACHAGVNVPGALIQHYMNAHPDFARACAAEAAVPFPLDQERAAVADTYYGRTVVEIAWQNTQPILTAVPGKGAFTTAIKGHPSRLFEVNNLLRSYTSFNDSARAQKEKLQEEQRRAASASSASSLSATESESESESEAGPRPEAASTASTPDVSDSEGELGPDADGGRVRVRPCGDLIDGDVSTIKGSFTPGYGKFYGFLQCADCLPKGCPETFTPAGEASAAATTTSTNNKDLGKSGNGDKSSGKGESGSEGEGLRKLKAGAGALDEVPEVHAGPLMSSPRLLRDELVQLLPTKEVLDDIGECTPRFIMSRAIVHNLLKAVKEQVHSAAAEAGIPNVLTCLSIKTQPHPVVLNEARKLGFLPEAISTAELRTALACGFKLEDAVMNGPAKWYDILGPLHLKTAERNKGLAASRPPVDADAEAPARHFGTRKPTAWKSFDVADPASGVPESEDLEALARATGDGTAKPALKMIFADSLCELTDLIDKVLDPAHWLTAEVVGIRLAAAGLVESRFGLRTDCPKVLAAAAQELRRLPEGVKIGVHFHFASSTIGLHRWAALAKSFIGCVRNIEAMAARPVRLLDFGGGWPSHLIEDPATRPVLVDVYGHAKRLLKDLDTIAVEPGKCVSEHAGALVMRVHSVRETVNTRMAIADGCCADAAALVAHPHPVFHMRQDEQGVTRWTALKNGSDDVGGRSCMEWDVIANNVELPADIKEGDYLCVAFVGAYDATISYGFGDGSPREMTVV